MTKLTKTFFTAFALVAFFSAVAFSAGSISVVEFTGDVQFQIANENWKPISTTTELDTGDLIKTGPDATVVLQWFGENIIKISPLTSIEIKEIAGRGDAEISKLNIENGRVFMKVKKLSGNSEFEVTTPIARAAVRGTEWSAEHSIQNKLSSFAVFLGSIEVEAMDVIKIVDAEYFVDVKPGEEPMDPEPLPDVRIETLEKESKEVDEILSDEVETGEMPDNEIEDIADFITDEVIEQNLQDVINDNLMDPAADCCEY